MLDRSDQKSGKWLEVREKSGNFVMKIEWQPCSPIWSTVYCLNGMQISIIVCRIVMHLLTMVVLRSTQPMNMM